MGYTIVSRNSKEPKNDDKKSISPRKEDLVEGKKEITPRVSMLPFVLLLLVSAIIKLQPPPQRN